MKQYRIHYKVLNGIEATNEAGEVVTKDFYTMTAPMSIEEAEKVLASLNLDDEVEDVELKEA